MSNDTQQIVNKAWNVAQVLRDDGLSYTAYTEQITFLLFLKMADEQTKPPYNRPPIVPAKFSWESLPKREGARHLFRYSSQRRRAAHTCEKGACPLVRPVWGKAGT